MCEHRYRNAQIEYAADAAGIEVDPVTRTDDQGSDVNSSTSGEGAATVLTTSATAPKTTMQTTIPKHALHPLTCGSVNHLLEDKEDKDDGEAIDDDDRDGDNGSGNITSKKSRRAKVSELIPSTATATWTSKPTFQLGMNFRSLSLCLCVRACGVKEERRGSSGESSCSFDENEN